MKLPRFRLIAAVLALASLAYAIQDRSPVSVAERINLAPSQSDEGWDHRFAPPGVNGSIGSLASSGDILYVAGGFSQAGGIDANRVAKWDPANEQWSALGPGLSRTVRALAASGNYLYAGGDFTSGPNITYVARWDEATGEWSNIGNITGGVVLALAATEEGILYVGGNFSGAGGVSANYIAKWDSNTGEWSTVGSGSQNGTNGNVNAIAVNGGEVYVGGTFSQAGGLAASRVARWNGSQWAALGSGLNASVEGVAVRGSDVYVGGDFTSAGGVAAAHIARWNSDSAQWFDVGGGTNGLVRPIKFEPNGDLYAGGIFTQAGGVSASNIARWDGNNWYAVGEGLPSTGVAIELIGSTIYAGGYAFGGNNPPSIAAWDGNQWNSLGQGLNYWANTVASDNNGNVYVAGDFGAAGGHVTGKIAKWDGNTWSALGSGIEGSSIGAIVVSGDYVYVGGDFPIAGGIPVNNIARWNITTGVWSALGAGIEGGVSTLAVSGRDLYVGGYFSRAGDINANHIAKWNMDTGYWSPLGSGVEGSSYRGVYSIAVNGSDVYAGGKFEAAGGASANNIARWDANTGEWHALGSGVTGPDHPTVYGVEIVGNDVYVGGAFDTAGGVSASNIARWNGTTWAALGSGISNYVYEINVNDIDVYVAGSFETAGGIPVNNVAHWDSGIGEWSGLGSGTYGAVFSIDAHTNGTIYIAGAFTTAGNKPSQGFGAWHYEYLTPPRCRGERFTDVCPDDFFYEPVQELSQANIISGYGNTPPCDNRRHVPCFKPFSNITRGQVAKVISLAAGFGEPVSGQSFEDVPPTNTFYAFIERMASRGIIGGYACGASEHEPCIPPQNRPYFRSGADVTRGQLSKMGAQAFGFNEPVSGQTFQDVPPSNVFYTYVSRMAVRGVIGGYPCGSNAQEPCIAPENRPYFRPNNQITRGQTSKIVYLSDTQPTPTVTGTPPTSTPTNTANSTVTSTPTSTPACGLYWHVVPSGDGPAGSELRDMAVLSTDDIWAVGITSGPNTSLIMHWDGANWSVVSNFLPVILNSVEAISPNDVWAVGQGDAGFTLIMHWDGSTWSQVASPKGLLYGVSGVASNDVWAVGVTSTLGGPLLLHWDGITWTSVQSPMETGFLVGVDAISSNDVWAVGWSGSSVSNTRTLHWNGSVWAVVSSPNIPSAYNELMAVSASGTNDVWAVGISQGTGIQDPMLTLTMHWNGSSWVIVPSPNPAPTSSGYRNSLNGVKALSANQAWAVGFYETGEDSPFRRTIVLRWDGTNWNQESSADPATGANLLYGVEAITPLDVWAVGFKANVMTYATTLVERYHDPCAISTPTHTLTPVR